MEIPACAGMSAPVNGWKLRRDNRGDLRGAQVTLAEVRAPVVLQFHGLLDYGVHATVT
jgi:hypothetical protein